MPPLKRRTYFKNTLGRGRVGYPLSQFYAIDYVGEIVDASGNSVFDGLGFQTLPLEIACMLVDAVNRKEATE